MNVLPIGLVLPNAPVHPRPSVRLPGWALLTLRLGLSPRVRGGESARPCGWLGRVRVGEDCALRLLTVGSPVVGLSRSGATWPDAVPVARIYANVAAPAAQLVPVDDTSGGAIGTFRGRFTPGAVNPPGRYFALYGYTVGGRSRSVVKGEDDSRELSSLGSLD